LGIKYLFIDEIFRYDNRRQELKNILDSFDMKVIFSGSSSLAVYDGVIDLGRRAYHYKMYTLSFREFLKLKYEIDLPKISFENLITNHEKLSMEYGLQIKQSSFDEYLKHGAYPFGLHLNANEFITRLQHIGDRIILEDLKHIREYDTQSLKKLSNLIYFIADTSPSELSINSLSKKI
jgi:predicted AAA+ superfamily ATPase